MKQRSCTRCVELQAICEAANKDLADAWRLNVQLAREIAELRNMIELYKQHLGAK